MELHLLSDGHFTLDKSLLVYTKYQGQIYEACMHFWYFGPSPPDETLLQEAVELAIDIEENFLP